MSKISELSDGGSLQSTDFLIAVRSGGNVKVQADGAVTGTTGQFSTSLNVDGRLTADGLTVDGTANLNSAVTITSTSAALFFMESDTTDLNTRIRNNGGNLAFHTVDDSKGSVGLRFAINNSTGDISFYEDTGTTPKFFWDASAESLGIGTTSPQSLLDVSATNPILTLTSTRASNSQGDSLGVIKFFNTDGNNNGPNNAALVEAVAATASGSDANLLFKTIRGASEGDDATEAMRIDSSGNVGIGTDDPTVASGNGLAIYDATVPRVQLRNSASGDTSSDGAGIFMSGSDLGIENRESSNIIFYNNAEAMRLDASGNLLVSLTSESQWTNTAGFATRSSGSTTITRSSAQPLLLNRLSTDGDIAVFYKDGTTVGSIGVNDSTLLQLNCSAVSGYGVFIADGGANKFGFVSGENAWRPASDNFFDLGTASRRYDDIYATNSTIQTSDANEKQDVAELDEAERRVAVAAKGLLRKFRWIDSVEAKGDEARIHFGIIAQDLQAAFEAEGLDAGRYAMFIHSTWTDEETGEERSRMGVRYSELLAFIIAAL